MASTTSSTPALSPRTIAASVDELIDGCTERRPFQTAETRSSSVFEHVTIQGEHLVLKHVHPDLDFAMRASGDLGSRVLRTWQAGLFDAAPDLIDHATVGMAPGGGRNGWGATILMRDVSADLVPPGDAPLSVDEQFRLLDACAALSARLWGWQDDLGLLPNATRLGFFGEAAIAGERGIGFPEAVPRIAGEGWERFAFRVDGPVRDLVGELRRDPAPLVDALAETPATFLHGDWKLSNLGFAGDGRAVLIDWAYPGEGPVCNELVWYLALNRDRLPVGETKESTIATFRAALERHGVDTDGWWDRQLGLCMVGGLLQFGWEKALGDNDELAWWCAAAGDGARWL